MLRSKLLHPGILQALGEAGHGSVILISDGNFPHGTTPFPGAPVIYLNLSPGKMSVTDVLAAVAPSIPIESVSLMDNGTPVAPEAHAPIRSLLPASVPVQLIDRTAFYEATKSSDVALVIATADTRLFACVLLTIGVIPPAEATSLGS
jgi:L-fucose mutarotase